MWAGRIHRARAASLARIRVEHTRRLDLDTPRPRHTHHQRRCRRVGMRPDTHFHRYCHQHHRPALGPLGIHMEYTLPAYIADRAHNRHLQHSDCSQFHRHRRHSHGHRHILERDLNMGHYLDMQIDPLRRPLGKDHTLAQHSLPAIELGLGYIETDRPRLGPGNSLAHTHQYSLDRHLRFDSLHRDYRRILDRLGNQRPWHRRKNGQYNDRPDTSHRHRSHRLRRRRYKHSLVARIQLE